MISATDSKGIVYARNKSKYLLIIIIIILLNVFLKVKSDDVPSWNYIQHGDDWETLDGSLCDASLNNQAPLKLSSQNIKYLPQEKFFFADSSLNVTAQFNLEDQNNNLVLNFEKYISTIHANFFQIEIENKETGKKEKVETYNDIGCKQIYFRIPGEHEIDGKTFDMELQFNCTALIKDIVHGQSTENIFNFFIAYPFNVKKDTSLQSKFFEDVFNNGSLTLNNTFVVSSVDEMMNNYNMFNRIFFYRGSKNFFDCMIDFYWLVVENKDITINQATYDKLKALLDPIKAPTGNNRKASDKSDTDVFLIDNKFFSEKLN